MQKLPLLKKRERKISCYEKIVKYYVVQGSDRHRLIYPFSSTNILPDNFTQYMQ